MELSRRLAAIVLAAGFSRRMGSFKLALPWAGETVIERVVSTLVSVSGIDVVVVLGHRAEEVRSLLAGQPVRFVVNTAYADGSMLTSISTGLASLGEDLAGALLCLGDQPQMLRSSVEAVIGEGERTRWQRVVIPSFEMRAGHPILLPRRIWPAIAASGGTLRDILHDHRDLVDYLVLDTPTILADLDTPEDYARAQQQLNRGEP